MGGGGGGGSSRVGSSSGSNLDKFTGSYNLLGGGKSGGGGGDGGGGSKLSSLQAPPGLFAAVSEALLCFPLTTEIRAALFELLLGGQPVPALEAPGWRGGKKGRLLGSSAKAMAKAAGEIGRSAAFAGKAAASAAGRVFSSFGGAGASPFASSAASAASSLSASLGADASREDNTGFGHAAFLPSAAGASSSGVPGIVHAAAAGMLLRLLDGCEDADMRGGVLELLLRLVEGAAANALAVLGQSGRAVQVDPFKSTLNPPGINRLKLNYDKLLPSFAFKSNLRSYRAGGRTGCCRCCGGKLGASPSGAMTRRWRRRWQRRRRGRRSAG
jgi:hypothetical protein